MPALIAWAWGNRYLLIAIAATALLGWKEHTIADLRAEIAAARLATAQAANVATAAALDDLVKLNDLGYAAIAAAEKSAGERAATVAKIKETARNVPIPPNACTTVGPRLGAVLGGLRTQQSAAAHRTPRGEGQAAAPAAGVRR
jgi:hypothetical protein